jgi:hypothetical protein
MMSRIPLPESADVPPAVRERYERPAYDQTDPDEWIDQEDARPDPDFDDELA